MLRHNASARPATNTDWARHEFAHARLPDHRLVKRLISISTDFAQHPTAPIPQACGSWGNAKAAYRFFDNDAVEPQAILEAHVQATVQRVQSHPWVLCVQDTTKLNYSTHPQTQGLGPISNNRHKTIGLFLHSTLTLSPAGQPLGLLHTRIWARRTFGRSSNQRNRLPRTRKESQKWMDSFAACQEAATHCPGTRLVNVADREGDLYDLFAAALAPTDSPRVEVLVRAQHNRQVAHRQKYLWDYLAAQRVSIHLRVQGTAQRWSTRPAGHAEHPLCPGDLAATLLEAGPTPADALGRGSSRNAAAQRSEGHLLAPADHPAGGDGPSCSRESPLVYATLAN